MDDLLDQTTYGRSATLKLGAGVGPGLEGLADLGREGSGGTSLSQKLVRYAREHYTHAEIRDEGDVAVFCDCTVPDGQGRRLACEIHVVTTFGELRDLLGY